MWLFHRDGREEGSETMTGKDLFKIGIVFIGGGILCGVLCGALAGNFTFATVAVAGGLAIIAGLFGWVVGAIHGEDHADRRACDRVVECLQKLRFKPVYEVTRENMMWNKALDAAERALVKRLGGGE